MAVLLLLLIFGVGSYVVLSWVGLCLLDRLERWSTGLHPRPRP